MKNAPIFIIGAILGVAISAAITLLFAPSSGKEMRARIGLEAKSDREKVQAGYEKARHQVQESIEKMQHHQQDEGGQVG